MLLFVASGACAMGDRERYVKGERVVVDVVAPQTDPCSSDPRNVPSDFYSFDPPPSNRLLFLEIPWHDYAPFRHPRGLAKNNGLATRWIGPSCGLFFSSLARVFGMQTDFRLNLLCPSSAPTHAIPCLLTVNLRLVF